MLSAPEPPSLAAQGAISLSQRGSWRLGWLTLDDSALVFRQPGRHTAIQIALDSVIGLDHDRRTFILVAKPVVRVTYRSGQPVRPRVLWLITARLAEWTSALELRAGPLGGALPAPVPPPRQEPEVVAVPAGPDAGPLGEQLARITGTEAIVLDYLAHRGHATTAELMALVGAEAEATLLRYLRDGFRRLEPVLDGPAIRYEGSFFDQVSGAVRRQAWRADDAVARSWLACRAPADVLAEGDDLVVVTTLPTRVRGAVPRARIEPGGSAVVVHADGHARWIALPEPVAGAASCAMSPNGTLVIRARRRHGGDQES